MGKTFLMKKAVLENKTDFCKKAIENGRVVSMECLAVSQALETLDEEQQLKLFWPMIIFSHLHYLFRGKMVIAEGRQYEFPQKPSSLVDLLKELKTLFLNSPFYQQYTTLGKAYDLLLLLTNAVWSSNSTSTVFLLDEINYWATTPSSHCKQSNDNHTYLSYLLDQLFYLKCTPLCICAGTTDGKLPLISEGTHVRVFPLQLTTLSMGGVFQFGKNYFALLNKTESESFNFFWPQSEEEMTKDYLLITMIYYTCQVPRLLKVAIQVIFSLFYNDINHYR